MKKFLSKDFLLENDFGGLLYHEYASKMPIIDYHNHLPPVDIAENRKFNSITEAWLEGDHYKWRAMRAFGISEDYVTGKESDKDKFLKWSSVVPYTVRNPLYHWTHLELQRYFNIEELLSPDTAEKIYTESSDQLAQDSHSCLGLLEQMNVELVCTTDDPADDLVYHKQMTDRTGVKMLPTFRPDKLYAVQSDTYLQYISALSKIVGYPIKTFSDLLNAAKDRVEYFHSVGGRLSDHGLEQLYYVDYSVEKSANVFTNFLSGKAPTLQEVRLFQMTFLVELSKMYFDKGWTQQFHLGAIRNNNTAKLRELGADTGYDSIGDYDQITGLSKFLRTLEEEGKLTKTILYNLNPRDNEAFATMAGNFMDGSVAGKIQYGSGWWFLDQKDGMEKQINALSNMGILSCFVGMLTDSRSFLSFPRHEYFRRLLCNMLG
ncbi:MAG: glucuronate isomerase, partial [Ekhidna sp.]|nr:glucuronate isomerase [Ekhidna sp.]